MNAQETQETRAAPRTARIVTPVASLDGLVGGHPETLRQIFFPGEAAGPAAPNPADSPQDAYRR